MSPFPWSPMTYAVLGAVLGIGLGLWFERLSLTERGVLKWQPVSKATRLLRIGVIVLVTAMLFGGLAWTEIVARMIDSPEVQPSKLGRDWRVHYHLILAALLIVATSIDFDCYVIPDQITIPGMLLGLGMAAGFGDLQMCHLWVDWSVAIPNLRGPDIPAWYDPHKNWHGLSWSLAGLITGAGLTWLAREISTRVLGQEAMGLGDVTLMAMIGSFVGWQAVTLVFLIAPIAGLIFGLSIMLVTGKTYLPYGPWLSIAAIVVLACWNILWEQTRVIFSDWLSLLILGGVGGGGLVVLLLLVRLYRSIPVKRA